MQNDFSSTDAPFTAYGGSTNISGQTYNIVDMPLWGTASFTETTEVGHVYEVSFDADLHGATNVRAYARESNYVTAVQLVLTANGTYSYQFTAQTSSVTFIWQNEDSGNSPRDLSLDNVIVREINALGNYFLADVVNYSDYYPFGMQMPGRHERDESYRYGFQGQEMDDEIKGEGNSLNYEYRMHDPRVGRFFAVDPLAPKYPHNSPYAFSENRVTNAVELEGLEADDITPNGGTINLPASANILERYDGDGYRQKIYGDPEKGERYEYYAVDGSVRSFEYDGIVYDASYDLKTGEFLGYHNADRFGTNSISYDRKPDISYGSSTVSRTVFFWDTEGAGEVTAGVAGAVLTKGPPPQYKINPGYAAAGAIIITTAAVTASVKYTTKSYDFALTRPVAIPTTDVDVDTKKPSPPIILYHYTNAAGMTGILSSQVIWPSLKAVNPADARYGDGVYWSDIIPGTMNSATLARTFKGIPNKYLYTHFIAVDVSGLPLVYGRNGVYVTPTQTNLPVAGRIISFGSVPQ